VHRFIILSSHAGRLVLDLLIVQTQGKEVVLLWLETAQLVREVFVDAGRQNLLLEGLETALSVEKQSRLKLFAVDSGSVEGGLRGFPVTNERVQVSDLIVRFTV
jgi:hypothetical protein